MGLLSKVTKKFKGTAVGAVAAPFTGGLSLAAGAAYDYANYQKQLQKQQNKANQAAIDRANAYDMYTWDLANQYNDPRQQMARLKAAGLNPNLVYGSGSVTGNTTGTAGSNGVADVGVADVVGGTLDKVTRGLGVAQGFANLRNTNNQNELLNYQMGQTEAQTNNIRMQTEMMPFERSYKQAQMDHMYAQDAAMSYNLKWAKDHDVPVNYVPDASKDIWNTFSSFAKRKLSQSSKNVLDNPPRNGDTGFGKFLKWFWTGE